MRLKTVGFRITFATHNKRRAGTSSHWPEPPQCSFILNLRPFPLRQPSNNSEPFDASMPHTNRRKKSQNQYQHSKRVQLEDPDGWTHVVETKGSTKKHTEVPLHSDDLSPAEPPDGETFDKIKAQFEQHRSRWLDSTCWASLKENLSRQFSRDKPKITNAVCIALGSPSGLGRHGTVDCRARSMNQLAAFVAILDLFGMDS